MVEKLNYGWQAGGGYVEPTREVICDKINELIDTVNGILDYAPLKMAMKAEPKKCEIPAENATISKMENVETLAENVQQISYMAPGDITVFQGFGCSVEFDRPLPEGTRITIKSITKGE